MEKRQKRSLECIKIPLILQALKYAKVRTNFPDLRIGELKNLDKNGQNGSEEKSYYIKFRPTFWYSHRDACVFMNTKSQFD